MKTIDLVAVTQVVDSETGNESIGELDYRVCSSALEMWMSRGPGVDARRVLLVKELRSLADALEAGDDPFRNPIEWARDRRAKYEDAWAEAEGTPRP